MRADPQRLNHFHSIPDLQAVTLTATLELPAYEKIDVSEAQPYRRAGAMKICYSYLIVLVLMS